MLAAAAATLGREVRVFIRPAAIPSTDDGSSADPHMDDESDDFYEFTAEDYARAVASRKPDIFLKTRKIREEEEAARRARITKAIIRVQFPDNYVLESAFQPSDHITLLNDLILKVILHPELPFYLYTTPPRQRLKNLQQSMYAAGLAPGALVYFSYESKGQERIFEEPYLRPEIIALTNLHLTASPVVKGDTTLQDGDHESDLSIVDSSMEPKKEVKRAGGKPKWFKR